MQVLFDQGTPVPLRGFLISHSVTTVYEKGWSQTRNGELLLLAELHKFDVFVTTDQSLKYQQNFSDRKIAVLVLPTTRWPVLQNYGAQIDEVLKSISPGTFLEFQL